ncbi:MAG: HD domain-containing protein, partial [Methanothrix sp.]
FPAQDSDLRQNIALKQEHTRRVCEEIVAVGKELGLSKAKTDLAEVMALFHDVGRFEQYLHYRTFVDGKSVNHAELGVKILREKNVLAGLDMHTRELVLSVIACHNRAHLSDIDDPVCLFFARLLRDADKLDIYRVVTDCYTERADRKNKAVELDLPDIPEISHEVFQYFMARRVIQHAQLKTLNDFKLLQLAWIFDINFTPALRRVCERGYVQIILNSLPDMPQTREISLLIETYLSKPAQCLETGEGCR